MSCGVIKNLFRSLHNAINGIQILQMGFKPRGIWTLQNNEIRTWQKGNERLNIDIWTSFTNLARTA